MCQDIVKEFKKYDADPYKYFARFSGEHSVTGRVSGVAQSLTSPRACLGGFLLITSPRCRRNTTST